MGLFIVNLLVRLRTQLVKLNTYQSTFEKMWTEDRANDERVRREAAQERQIENLRTPQLMQARARIENQINEILEGVGPAPPRGTPEYEQFMREIGDYLRNVEGN
ncbi:hypothetical protein GGR51DRAFT_554430 [Nemania sp. FL0031]|nr:hypothetical protein GGR51DRAFT_554430 [Nemania sp. FL0031]